MKFDGHADGVDIQPHEGEEGQEDEYYDSEKYPAPPAIPVAIAIVTPISVVIAAATACVSLVVE